jgi:5-methylcytosine-specific restriction endonuclease McrA
MFAEDKEDRGYMKKRFELSQTQGVAVPIDGLIKDIKEVAAQSGKETVTYRQYESIGKYSGSTILRRFGSWNIALEKAGLNISNEFNINEERLFENIEQLWIKLGRQPRKIDLNSSLSEYSEGPYKRLFRSWRGALEQFIVYINSQKENERVIAERAPTDKPQPRTSRDPSLRLRFLVMRRDTFKCQHCGKSPATHANIELHIDHVIPWSEGGETTFDNLRTLCRDCNLGKSNLMEKG